MENITTRDLRFAVEPYQRLALSAAEAGPMGVFLMLQPSGNHGANWTMSTLMEPEQARVIGEAFLAAADACKEAV